MEIPLNFNVFNIIIIFGATQGVFFSLVVLLNKKYKSSANFYLAQVILYLSLNNLYYWFADTNISNDFEYFENIYIPWNLLILPMFYYFTTSYLRGKRKMLKNKNFFLIPFFVCLIMHFLLFLYHVFLTELITIPIEFIRGFYYAEEYFSVLFSVFIMYKLFILVTTYEKNHSEYSIKKVTVETKWLKQLLYFGLLICFIWIVIVLSSQLNSYNLFGNWTRYFLWLSMSFLIYWLGYSGIYYSGIFNQRQQIRKNILITERAKEKPINTSKFLEIETIIQSEKLFLNPHFSLFVLSKKTNLNESYISQLFNKNSTVNFTTYINRLRVKEAKLFLKNEAYQNYTIISIGLEAGFNSKSAFYTAFKKEAG
mgnify:FL=1